MVTRDHTAVQNRSCNKHGTGTWRDRERGGVWRWQRACSGVSERVARRQCGAVWRWQRESGGAWCAAHLTIERPTSTLPRYHAHQLVAGICRRVERRNRRAPHWRGRRHLCRHPPRRRFCHAIGSVTSHRVVTSHLVVTSQCIAAVKKLASPRKTNSAKGSSTPRLARWPQWCAQRAVRPSTKSGRKRQKAAESGSPAPNAQSNRAVGLRSAVGFPPQECYCPTSR